MDLAENEYKIAKVSDIPEGESRVFEAGGRMVAVFHNAGKFQAIDDMCPHAGASLAEGWVEDGCVTCPWHAWQFRLDDGTYIQNPRMKADVFPVRVEGDDLIVTVNPRG
jgi:nitrite reductase (NADH) small subunit/3-phenylpropionate/trans-cinnamate dioxygenase ferredoxin subunit